MKEEEKFVLDGKPITGVPYYGDPVRGGAYHSMYGTGLP